jgi:hypothetical protein
MAITLEAGLRPPGQVREWEVLGGWPPAEWPGAAKGGCRLKEGLGCARAAREQRPGAARRGD